MWNLPAVLALQQPPVCVDLTLQPGLGVQQHLLLLVLPFEIAADLGQLLLHIISQALYVGQLGAVLGLGFCIPEILSAEGKECKKSCCNTVSGARWPVFNLALPFFSSVTLGKLPSFSEPQFYSIKNEE